MKAVNSPKLRATFDPANFVQAGQVTKKAYEMLKPYVAYMQGGLNYSHVKICLEDMVKKLG